MFKKLLSTIVVTLSFSPSVAVDNVDGWFVGNNSKLVDFPWSCYTHLHGYTPDVDENGFASCNKNNTAMMSWIDTVHKHNKKVVWGLGNVDIHNVLWGDAEEEGTNYIKTIGKAMEDCDIDGIEVDYEWADTNWGKTGIIPALQSTKYTEFLSSIKKNIAPHREVSADVSIWGLAKGEYVLGVFPWVNVTMLNNGEFDYINTMSYHYAPNNSILPWEKDGLFLHTLWGIDKKRVNIGIPYYHVNKNPMMNTQTNRNLGKWIAEGGWRGAFVFAATYDQYDKPLVYELCDGLSL